jgi:putative ubiquitin-RnfH superfamily antitoxin RatB of RatAB toxin-antitoxin module
VTGEMTFAEISIEIVYAQPQYSVAKSLRLKHGATIAEALAAAAEHPDFQGVDLKDSPVGIFGRVMSRESRLNDGDRLEIYRPLMEEPKLARRQRARPQKASKSVRS